MFPLSPRQRLELYPNQTFKYNILTPGTSRDSLLHEKWIIVGIEKIGVYLANKQWHRNQPHMPITNHPRNQNAHRK